MPSALGGGSVPFHLPLEGGQRGIHRRQLALQSISPKGEHAQLPLLVAQLARRSIFPTGGSRAAIAKGRKHGEHWKLEQVLASLSNPPRLNRRTFRQIGQGSHDEVLLSHGCSKSLVLPVLAHLQPSRWLLGVALGSSLMCGSDALAQTYVALMEGQRAIPLGGRFNTVPVLHSNQPEEVEGPGLLISTVPGVALAAENGMALEMPAYTFNGEFGLHLHHKYLPPYRASKIGRAHV